MIGDQGELVLQLVLAKGLPEKNYRLLVLTKVRPEGLIIPMVHHIFQSQIYINPPIVENGYQGPKKSYRCT